MNMTVKILLLLFILMKKQEEGGEQSGLAEGETMFVWNTVEEEYSISMLRCFFPSFFILSSHYFCTIM